MESASGSTARWLTGYITLPRLANRKWYTAVCFCLWPQAVELDGRDTVALDIRADLGSDNYFWSWNTMVCSAVGVKQAFRQSDFPWRAAFTGPAAKSKLQSMCRP